MDAKNGKPRFWDNLIALKGGLFGDQLAGWTPGRRRLDVADIVRIVMVRSDAEGVIDNVGGGEITALDPPMDRLRVVAIPR
ncbi:MAG: hypothetical protein ABII76_14440 [Pseudomonadota bacterium]